jgi:4-hydroxy-tetrahydrodipicolinate synthase
MQELTGVLVPMITCFDDHGNINARAIRKLTDFLIESDVHGLIPTASNGEHPHLSDKELSQVWEVVIEESAGRVPVAPCTTADTTARVTKLCKRAEATGASAVLVGPPPYFGANLTDSELLIFYRDVAREIDIPIIIYNEPLLHGADVRPELVLELSKVPNISYIKESSYNSVRVHEIISAVGKDFSVFIGACNIALESFALGAKGWITGAHNFIPKMAVELYNLCSKEKDFDKARTLYYDSILPICRWIASTPQSYQAVREAVKSLGFDVGSPRKPLISIGEKQRKDLKQLLKQINVHV